MKRAAASASEEGYLLLGLVVACFLMLLALSVAAPRVAKELERDRELESENRAEQYVRAIQLYYRRNNTYPSSIEQLLGTGSSSGIGSAVNVHYLRQQYKDPLTRDDFRLIRVNENKTQVKGFFGEPLEGLAQGNLGAAAGMVSNIPGAAGPNGAQASGGFGASATGASGGLGSSSGGGFSISSGTGGTGSTPAGTNVNGITGTSTPGTPAGGSGTDATTFQGSKAGIVGVGSSAKGHGLLEWNGSQNIEDWEFLYDPRVELLKAKVSLLGGAAAAAGAGTLGSGFQPAGATGATGSPLGMGSGSTPGTSTPGASPIATPGSATQ